MSNTPKKSEYTVQITNQVVVQGEKELEEARQRIIALQQELDRARATIQSLEGDLRRSAEEMDHFARGSGLGILRDELDRYRETATQAVYEFRAFLESVNLNNVHGDNDYMFEDIFDRIKNGSMTAGQAIMRVKTEMSELMEESYRKSDTAFDSRSMQQFISTLDRVAATTDQIISKMNSLEAGGGIGITGSTGAASASSEASNLAAALNMIQQSAQGMTDELKDSYDKITRLVGAMSEYASLDETKLLGVSQAFRNIADIGRGNYGTKSIANIVFLAKELQSIGSSGAGLRFDFTGFNDLKVSKSSISNLATYLPLIAEVNAEKLEKVSKIDLTGFNNLKINKGSVSAISNLTHAMNELYDVTKAISAAVDTEEKKARTRGVSDTSVYKTYRQSVELLNKNSGVQDSDAAAHSRLAESIKQMGEAIKYAEERSVSLNEAFKALGLNGTTVLNEAHLASERFKTSASEMGAQAAKGITPIVADSKEYSSALQRIEGLLKAVTAAQNRFTAARTGKGRGDYDALAGYAQQLSELRARLSEGKLSQQEFNAEIRKISSGVGGAISSIQALGENTLSVGQKVKKVFGKFAVWFGASRIFFTAIRLIRQMVTNVKNLDTAMTELKKVTNETDETYTRFLINATRRAKELGATLTDVVSASADFARLGFSLEEAEKLADAALVYKNVGDGIDDINTASESLIATLQAFSKELKPEDVMRIVDKFNEVGNNFAISSKGVGDALLRSAASMNAAGNTLDETIALATAANTIVQNPESVGTTLKTISMYLRAAKTEAEEAGESTDGMASSISELRSEILALTGNEVDIQIDNDTFKSTYQIMKELSVVWSDLSDTTQANITEMVGGKRNSNVVSALLENFSVAEKALTSSANSAGSALKENEKFLDSINGKLAVFKATLETFSSNLISSEFVKGIISAGTWLVGTLDTLNKINTLLPLILSSIMTYKAVRVSLNAIEKARNVESIAQSLVQQKGLTDALTLSVTSLSAEEKKLLAARVNELILSKQLEKSKGEEILATLGLAGANATLDASNKKLVLSMKAVFSSIPVWGWISLITSAITTAISLFGIFSQKTEETIDDINQKIEESNRAMQSAAQEFRNLEKSSREEIFPRFTELAKGVNDFGENISLTDEEYEEFIDLNNKLAEMFPDLQRGYDSNGNAVLGLSYNVDTLAGSLENLLEVQRQVTLSTIADGMGDAITNIQSKTEATNDSIEGITASIEKWKWAKNHVYDIFALTADKFSGGIVNPKVSKEYTRLATVANLGFEEKGLKEIFEALYQTEFKDFSAVQDMLEEMILPEDWSKRLDEYIDQAIAIESRKIKQLEDDLGLVWADFNPIASAWLQTNSKYSALNQNIQNVANAMVSGIDFSQVKGADTEAGVQEYIEKYILNPFFNMPESAQGAIEKAFEDFSAKELSQEDFHKEILSAFDSMFAEMSDKEVENFKDVFVSSLGAMGFAGTSFGQVLSSLTRSWTKIKETGVESADELSVAIDKAAKKYNKLTNGNLDYRKRPFITPEKMKEVYPEFDGEIATTYSEYHTIGEGSALYTIDITPILEDGTVLSPEALNDYISGLITGDGIEGILASDTKNLVINIAPGDYDEEYWRSYQEALSEVKDEHWELVKQQRALEHVSVLGGIDKELSDGLKQLDKIYADIIEGESFDYSAILNNDEFATAFGGLTKEYNEFISVITRSPDDLDACQDSFNKLTTAFIAQSKELNNVTESTKDSVIAYLEQNGVANAASIVEQQLAYNTEYLRYTTGEYADMTAEATKKLYLECEAGTVAQQVLSRLTIEKTLTNENGINTESDIDQLIALADAARMTTASLKNVIKAKEYQAEVDRYAAIIAANPDSPYIGGAYQQLRKYEELVDGLLKNVEYDKINPENFYAKYTGGDSSASALDKASKDVETWFEKELRRRQHLIEMDQQSTEEYLNWLDSAYKKAYKEGIIELEDYYKYEEEVYQGRRDLFEDLLGDIEHKISMKEDVEGESKNIIGLYSTLIAEVEKEISRARNRGLSDEDDYLQELQNRHKEYSDSIKSIREEALEGAKDALDELIDYRLDIIKQDIENEKDALDKKLDNLKEFYDKQKDLLQDQYDEEKYLEEQAEKRRSVSDIRAELEQLRFDDSAWAELRKAELQKELSDAEKDLRDFEDDRALDLALDAIDKSYEAQEKQIQAEMDALEDRLNDPHALYNQALAEIQKSTSGLYQEMLEYNRKHGSGKDSEVKDIYEEAYKALLEYKNVYGKDYNGVVIANSTKYNASTGSNGSSKKPSSSGTQASSSSTASKPATSSAPSLTNGSTVRIKDSATRFGSKSQNAYMASYVPGGTYTVYGRDGDQVLIGRNGVYTGWVKKDDIVGYASGTRNAKRGLHEIDEDGIETIFESSDGSRYKMFSGGEKVLNARASDFLYKFATSGGDILAKLFDGTLGNKLFDKIRSQAPKNEIAMGDIIIQGNADRHTVSEIRRAQRDGLSDLLKSFGKLSK